MWLSIAVFIQNKHLSLLNKFIGYQTVWLCIMVTKCRIILQIYWGGGGGGGGGGKGASFMYDIKPTKISQLVRPRASHDTARAGLSTFFFLKQIIKMKNKKRALRWKTLQSHHIERPQVDNGYSLFLPSSVHVKHLSRNEV